MTFAVLFALLSMTLVSRFVEGTWFAPGAFFAAFWTAMVAFPVILMPQFPSSPTAALVVLVFVLIAVAGSFLGRRIAQAVEAGLTRSYPIGSNALDRPAEALVVICTIGALGGLVGLLASRGISLSVLLDPSQLLIAAAQTAIDRYQNNYMPPLVFRIGQIFLFAGACMGGSMLGLRRLRARGKWCVGGLFFIAFCSSVILTSKANILYVLFVFAGAYLAGTVLRLGKGRLVAWQFITVRSSLGFLSVATIFVFLMGVRYGFDRPGDELFQIVSEKLLVYVFGHFSPFAAWVDSGGINSVSPTGGSFTFAGLYSALGISARIPGLYQPLIFDQYDLASNVFTVFRSLIEDFGLPGGMMVLGVICAIAGAAFEFARNRRFLSFCVPFLTLFYAFTLWSHVTSIWSYNSVLFGVILVSPVFLIAELSQIQKR